jgi:drug/metabolite transporter (DMT)-like permease
MTTERKGELFAFSNAFFQGLFPIITVLSYLALPNIISLAITTFISSIFFLILVIYKNRLPELRNPLLWKYIMVIVFFLGILFYTFFYLGLSRTSPGNASIIALFEVFTSYIFFNIFEKEPFSLESKAGTVLMVAGAVIVLAPNFSHLNLGDIFILLATFCAPIGNFFQQKAKDISSTETTLFLRSIISAPLLLLLAYILGQHLQIEQIRESFLFLVINGVLIFGLSRMFWVESISRISVTKANALGSVTPFFTLFFALLIFHQFPTIFQCASLILFFFGVLLLTGHIKLKHR